MLTYKNIGYMATEWKLKWQLFFLEAMSVNVNIVVSSVCAVRKEYEWLLLYHLSKVYGIVVKIP